VDFISVVERISSVSDQPIRLQQKRCLRAIDRRSTCDLCAAACPVDAITIDPLPDLNIEKCQACGLCLRVCPTGAFSGEDGISELFRCFQVMDKAETVEICCGQHPFPHQGPVDQKVVLRTRGCLANLGPSVYLGLFKMGVARISLRLDACNACRISKAQEYILQAAQDANLLFQGEANAPFVSMVKDCEPGWHSRPVIDVQNPPMSRRSFFDVFSRSSMRLVGQVINDPHTADDGDKGPSPERRRMGNALPLYPELFCSEKWPVIHQVFPLPDVRVSDACTACGVCASMCPTGALEFETDKEETQFLLRFSSKNCTGCGICVDYCAAEAASLLVGDEVLAKGLPEKALEKRVLIRGELERCERCHAFFTRNSHAETIKAEALCPLCEFRRTNPFGSIIPHK